MFKGPCNRNGYGQPNPTTNYHRTYSGDHATKVAQRPAACHPGGGTVLQHHVVHKESFKEVDGAKQAPANDRRYFDNNYPMKGNHHGGGSQSHHRYETYEETYEESCEEETYAYGAGRHHGHGHGAGAGGHRFEYQTHEETYEEEEEEDEEFVVGGGGCAQLRRGYRGA